MPFSPSLSPPWSNCLNITRSDLSSAVPNYLHLLVLAHYINTQLSISLFTEYEENAVQSALSQPYNFDPSVLAFRGRGVRSIPRICKIGLQSDLYAVLGI